MSTATRRKRRVDFLHGRSLFWSRAREAREIGDACFKLQFFSSLVRARRTALPCGRSKKRATEVSIRGVSCSASSGGMRVPGLGSRTAQIREPDQRLQSHEGVLAWRVNSTRRCGRGRAGSGTGTLATSVFSRRDSRHMLSTHAGSPRECTEVRLRLLQHATHIQIFVRGSIPVVLSGIAIRYRASTHERGKGSRARHRQCAAPVRHGVSGLAGLPDLGDAGSRASRLPIAQPFEHAYDAAATDAEVDPIASAWREADAVRRARRGFVNRDSHTCRGLRDVFAQ